MALRSRGQAFAGGSFGASCWVRARVAQARAVSVASPEERSLPAWGGAQRAGGKGSCGRHTFCLLCL